MFAEREQATLRSRWCIPPDNSPILLGRRLIGPPVYWPEYVRPYVKSHKNDDRDAEAIAEAATRPTMRFVELKSETQLDMQTLHRARDRLVGERTALINQLRAILLERGRTVAAGPAQAGAIPRGDAGAGNARPSLSPRMRQLIEDMRAEWRELDRRIAAFDNEFAAQARNDPAARRLATIPGIGVLNATALVAAIGNGQTFARGRDLAAWLGLVPRQVTTGGKPRLARHHQTRQQVPSQAADPRRASSPAEAGQ